MCKRPVQHPSTRCHFSRVGVGDDAKIVGWDPVVGPSNDETLAEQALAQQAYFESRFTPESRRDAAWAHIVEYLQRWWNPAAATILDVGAGYCTFINNAAAARRVAVDIHPRLREYAAPEVETIHASASDLAPLSDEMFDVVFASNLLEHLTRKDIGLALGEFRRVLRSGGRLILIQPNFRLCAKKYFDDYTHLTPISDRSMRDLLAVAGFRIVRVEPRFLPLTLKGRGGNLPFLIPFYLRLPWRPFAGQMLFIAEEA
jgi:SAM-dependent methyltransferase